MPAHIAPARPGPPLALHLPPDAHDVGGQLRPLLLPLHQLPQLQRRGRTAAEPCKSPTWLGSHEVCSGCWRPPGRASTHRQQPAVHWQYTGSTRWCRYLLHGHGCEDLQHAPLGPPLPVLGVLPAAHTRRGRHNANGHSQKATGQAGRRLARSTAGIGADAPGGRPSTPGSCLCKAGAAGQPAGANLRASGPRSSTASSPQSSSSSASACCWMPPCSTAQPTQIRTGANQEKDQRKVDAGWLGG